MASAAGEAEREHDPAWTITVSRMSASRTSSSRRNISAPGLRTKVKLRSPSSVKETNAMVVTASRQGSRRIQRTLFSRRVPSRYRPKSSSPTEQHMAASNPFRAAAMATFAGAPPAFRI